MTQHLCANRIWLQPVWVAVVATLSLASCSTPPPPVSAPAEVVLVRPPVPASPAVDQMGTASPGQQVGMPGPRAWRWYSDYLFRGSSTVILSIDSQKAREIFGYASDNPSDWIGLDGSDPRRVRAVRDALVMAGVPGSRIETGAFGDPQLRRDGRVAVLVSH